MASNTFEFSIRPSRAETQPTEADIGLDTSSTQSYELQVENIVSFRAFIEYLTHLPSDNLKHFSSASETLRQLLVPTETPTQYVGSGHSFTVHAKQRPQLPPDLAKLYPPAGLLTHRVYAVKSRHVNQSSLEKGMSPSTNVSVWRETAWECHILTHPALAQSQNIVTILGVLWESVLENSQIPHYLPVLAMEYADQGSLEDLLQPREFCLHPRLKKQILLGVCLGVQNLHDAGIVHADLKAGNVLLFSDGNDGFIAKLSDFGFTLHSFGHSSHVNVRGYSPPWDAPEIRNGELRSTNLAQIDIYSYGLLFWRVLLHGTTPFDMSLDGEDDVPHELQNIMRLEYRSANWLNAIHALKSDTTDLLLDNVLATVPAHHHDDDLHARRIISLCLRQNPADRIRAMSGITNVLASIPQELPSEDTRITPPEAKTFTSSLSFKHAAAKEFPSDLETSFTFHGAFASSSNLRDFSRMDLVQQLPPGTRQCLALDYRLQALNESNSRTVRAWSAFNYALSIVVEYDIQPDEEVVRWMHLAAELGYCEARSLLFRFQTALGSTPANQAFVVDCLAVAALQGSRSACRDLQYIDHDRFLQVCTEMEDTVEIQPGLSLDKVRHRGEILSKYPLDDPNKLLSFVQSHAQNPSLVSILGKMLRHAAAFNFIHAVEILIASGADVNHRDRYGKTPLIWACQKGCETIVLRLIEHGADPNLKDWISATPLHYTVYVSLKTVSQIVQALVSAGADIHAKSHGQLTKPTFTFERLTPFGTPLHWAVKHDYLSMVQALLSAGANCLESDGFPDAFESVSNSVIEYRLQEMKANPGKRYDRSPLEYAIEDHRADMMECMLQHLRNRQVSFSLPDLFDEEAAADRLQLICLHGSKYLENFRRTMALLLDGSTRTEIPAAFMRQAIECGSAMTVEYLLKEGFDPNFRIEGRTPLSIALSKRCGEIGVVLLRHGADPCIPGSGGSDICPPGQLFSFIYGTHVKDILEEMIARGADCHKFESQYVVLLGKAILENWQDVVQLLLEKGPHLTPVQSEVLEVMVNQNSRSAVIALGDFLRCARADGRLPIAVINDEVDLTVFHILMAVGEDIRDDEVNRRSLALLLQYYSSKDILNLGVADLGDSDDEHHTTNGRGWFPGTTALNIAVYTGNSQGVTALLKAGADPFTGDVPPLFQAFKRLLKDANPGWVTARLGGRVRRARRNHLNSIDTVLAFLRHDITELASSSTYRGREAIEQCLSIWRSAVYNKALNSTIDRWYNDTDRSVEQSRSSASTTSAEILINKEGSGSAGVAADQGFNAWTRIKADWIEAMTSTKRGLDTRF